MAALTISGIGVLSLGPLFILSIYGVGTAIFNLDILIIFAISALFRRRQSALILLGAVTLVLALQMTARIAPLYYFHPLQMLGYARFLSSLTIPYDRVLSWQGLTLFVILCVGMTAILMAPRHIGKRTGYGLAGMVALLMGLDAVNGTLGPAGRDDVVLPVNLVTSGSYQFTRVLMRRKFKDPAEHLPSATSLAISEPDIEAFAATGNNIGLVIVESLGMPVNPEIQNEIFAPLLTPEVKAAYDVRIGQIGSNGATTQAEIRELCNSTGHFSDISEARGTACLPARLRALGYETTGLHGMNAHMFDRFVWWPLVGLEHRLFPLQFNEAARSTLCGGAPFRGLCDALILQEFGQQLRHGQRQFVYALTLNSHLPVTGNAGREFGYTCPGLVAGTTICPLVRMWRGVVQNVADIALQADLPPSRIVVVGDHPPPLVEQQLRDEFERQQVPYAILIPRPKKAAGS